MSSEQRPTGKLWREFAVQVSKQNPKTRCRDCDKQTWLAWREGYCILHTNSTLHDRVDWYHTERQVAAEPAKLELPCVYLVGAEMTGKTTLVGFVAEAFAVPRLRGESARIVKDEYGGWSAIRSRGKASDAYQSAVFDEQLDMELRKTPHYVADRCLLDSLAYASEYATVTEKLWSRLHGTNPAKILSRLRQAVAFLVKPHKELSASDGERLVVSYEKQLRIDVKIELLLQLQGIRSVRINDLEANRREEQISLYLEAKGFVRK